MRCSSASVSEKFGIACTENPAPASTEDIARRRVVDVSASRTAVKAALSEPSVARD
jgi:hypothetical protein